MAEEWTIRVEGKEYGPADLDTLREWKADGRVLPENPARRSDSDLAAQEANWLTAAEIPGLFKIEPPPVQKPEVSGRAAEVRPPGRNLLTETFRIYFRGFFQFLTLTLLIALPSLCGRLFGM